MKLCLDVKNPKPAIKPSKDDLIIFDGKEWYITTKEELFKEYQDKMDAELKKIDNLIKKADKKLDDIENFKIDVSKQIVELSSIIKNFVKLQGE